MTDLIVNAVRALDDDAIAPRGTGRWLASNLPGRIAGAEYELLQAYTLAQLTNSALAISNLRSMPKPR